jgi:hypothetical protein
VALAAQAVASPAQVPLTFVFFIEHSSNQSTQYNPIASLQQGGRYGVANLEGADSSGTAIPPHNFFLGTHNPPASTTTPPRVGATARETAPNAEGLNFRGAMDPRVYWAFGGPSFTTTIPKHVDLRYATFDDDVPVASGVEARLIQAEAALRTGNVAGYLTFLNDLRAAAGANVLRLYPSTGANVVDARRSLFASTLPPLTDPGEGLGAAAARDARVRLLFRERAFWLFLTGHRQGDLRRMIRDYGYTQAQVFPTGPYYRTAGSFYGDDVAFPLPQREENNAQYDPKACIVEQA